MLLPSNLIKVDTLNQTVLLHFIETFIERL